MAHRLGAGRSPGKRIGGRQGRNFSEKPKLPAFAARCGKTARKEEFSAKILRPAPGFRS
jgi:hypothetical protein